MNIIYKKSLLLHFKEEEISLLAKDKEIPKYFVNHVLENIFEEIKNNFSIEDYIYNYTEKGVYKALAQEGITVLLVTQDLSVEENIKYLLDSNLIENVLYQFELQLKKLNQSDDFFHGKELKKMNFDLQETTKKEIWDILLKEKNYSNNRIKI